MLDKNLINNYILEKINNKENQITKKVSETFNINQNTAHDFINSLINKNIIKRVKRDLYIINSEEHEFSFKCPIQDESLIFDNFIAPLLTNYPNNVVKIWEYVCTEIINNVIDHSECKEMTIKVTKNYLKTSIEIIDDGIGIFNKIQRYFHLPNLKTAVNELFKGKITTDESKHSGEGIFFSSQILDKFYIISSGHFFSRQKFENDKITVINNSKGTIVSMTLSNSSRKELVELFNMYSTVHEGFYKTLIPIKNMFENDPVSRSQAKRLYSGLNKYTEIILDFDKVETIGQAFAHELFVVFQNEHKNVVLGCVNMNKNVEFMYNHVKKQIK